MSGHAKHLPADERRETTVEAVVDLAATRNPSEITTAVIARHMNVTQGALFRHFPTKDAIWHAVMEWAVERLLARLDEAVEGIASPVDALQAMFLSHVAFVAQHPGVPRMMFGELQRPQSPVRGMVQTVLKQYAQRLHRLLELAKSARAVPASLDAEAAAMLFIGTIQGLVMQSLLSGDMAAVRRDAPRVFAIYRRGIGSAQ